MQHSINRTSSRNSEFALKQLAITNTSNSLSPEAVYPIKPAKKCAHYGGTEYNLPECPGEKAL